jgi:hypothetical protein
MTLEALQNIGSGLGKESNRENLMVVVMGMPGHTDF